MRVALLITLGTTADPILKVVEEVHREAEELTVFLVFGRPFPGQTPSPFDVAHEAKERSEALGAAVRLFEVGDPEDIDRCLAVAREIIREAGEAQRLVVNFTGGTKPMAAAVVHVALTTPLTGELVLDYVGGERRDSQGRVLSEAMRITRAERTATQEHIYQTLDHLQRGRYREAAILAEGLPERGRGGFVRHAVEALVHWDEFNYPEAVHLLRRHRPSAEALLDDPELALLSRLFLNLLEPGNCLTALCRDLKRAQYGSALPESLRTNVEQDGHLLVADALENSARRLREGRPTDSVLRSYRAVEVAVQMRLMRAGIHPWKPRWEELDEALLGRYLALLGSSEPPRNLALTTGLSLLEALGNPLEEGLARKLQDLQQSRNHSYLEHGYGRLSAERAGRLLGYAHEICESLLEIPLEEARNAVSHAF